MGPSVTIAPPVTTTAPTVNPEAPTEGGIVLSVDTLNIPSQSYVAGTSAVDGVSFEYIQMGNYGDGLQMRDKDGKTSSIWNTTAFANPIVRIELVYSDTKDVAYSNPDAVVFTFGNEAQGTAYTTKLSTTAGVKTYTITPDAETYKFFKLEHDLGYSFYWKSITIVLADGTTVTTTNSPETTKEPETTDKPVADVTEPKATEANTTAPSAQGKGCGSAVCGGAVIVAFVAIAFAVSKKKD